MSNDNQTTDDNAIDPIKRWRLILGQYANESLTDQNFNQHELAIDKSLNYLYQNEYRRRGLKLNNEGDLANNINNIGGKENSLFNTVNWLNQSRRLFPHSTFERMQRLAIERYHMTDILNTPEGIDTLARNVTSLRLLLQFKGVINPDVHLAVKQLIRQVVNDILQQLKPIFTHAIHGRRNRFRHSSLSCSKNFDWRATIRQNLKNYHQQRQQLIIERIIFNSRTTRHLPWDIVLCVDQSGSMTCSIMYAAICASILAALPSCNVHLLVFDTQVIDLTLLADDPVEILMTVQLGGGTDIAKAMLYAEQKIKNPQRTLVTLISDFCEGGNLAQLYGTIARMNESRVKLLGLAALDYEANPVYDHQIAQQLANRGMHIAALTPEHFANWLAEVMQ